MRRTLVMLSEINAFTGEKEVSDLVFACSVGRLDWKHQYQRVVRENLEPF